MALPISQIHPSWEAFFDKEHQLLEEIFSSTANHQITPRTESIFRAFIAPKDSVRVVIFGQDPYPGENVADGLAFSASVTQPIPASLRNIFKEYHADLGFPLPSTPDLTRWSESGVMLLNRSLTTIVGERNAHVAQGWKRFTLEVAKELGEIDVVAILWGNYARELAPIFKHRIESPHPSPLSARLGFFGSKPFSRSNDLLREIGREPIDWML
jgi:uracil-DNA glycosylase